jgi:hypothetical protein
MNHNQNSFPNNRQIRRLSINTLRQCRTCLTFWQLLNAFSCSALLCIAKIALAISAGAWSCNFQNSIVKPSDIRQNYVVKELRISVILVMKT